MPAKLHGKRLRIDVWIDVEMNNFYKYSIKFHTDLINNFWSTKSNTAKFTLQGSCRNTSQLCLQNYMENGWELTSELTSKWNNFYKYSIKFHTDLINNFWSTKSNFRQIYREVAVIPADGACKIAWKTIENWRLNSRRNE